MSRLFFVSLLSFPPTAAASGGASSSGAQNQSKEYATSRDVQVVDSFEKMGLKDDLLRGIYAMGLFQFPSLPYSHLSSFCVCHMMLFCCVSRAVFSCLSTEVLAWLKCSFSSSSLLHSVFPIAHLYLVSVYLYCCLVLCPIENLLTM